MAETIAEAGTAAVYRGNFATKHELSHANFRPFLNNVAHCGAETVAEAPQLHSFGSSAARARS
jgi:hypothetical protein